MSDDRPMPRDVLDRLTREAARARPSGRPRSLADRIAGGHVSPPMRIHIVSYEDERWILGKMIRRLAEGLRMRGHEVSISRTVDPEAEINHHVIYTDYIANKTTLETVMITHIDIERELAKVKHQLIDVGVEMGLCMSYDAVHRLAHFGLPRGKLCYVLPAHDGLVEPRKTLVGLLTRTYPDGCKREGMLAALADQIDPREFRFAIMGAGWEPVIGTLRAKGFEVEYLDHFDLPTYREWVPRLDYYLYLGLDDGSMAFLDALAAGVPTIVTAQGYHLDVPGGITHAFATQGELQQIFHDIANAKRMRAQAVASLTWSEYARDHALVWEYLLLRKQALPIPTALGSELMALGGHLD